MALVLMIMSNHHGHGKSLHPPGSSMFCQLQLFTGQDLKKYGFNVKKGERVRIKKSIHSFRVTDTDQCCFEISRKGAKLYDLEGGDGLKTVGDLQATFFIRWVNCRNCAYFKNCYKPDVSG